MDIDRRKRIVKWVLIAVAAIAFVGCVMLRNADDGPSYGEYEGALCAQHGDQDC